MSRPTYSGSDPGRKTVGWAAVIAFHLLVGWALVTGTARKGLELIKKPLEAAVIQEVIIPPPPPPPPPPPRKSRRRSPKPKPHRRPFVPPSEVTPPPSPAPVMQAVATPPLEPQVIAPPVPPAAPAPPAAPTRSEIGVACPTQVKPGMPRRALEDGIEGVVRAQVLIRNGAVVKVDILSGPQVFRTVVRDAMLQYRCKSAEGDLVAIQEFVFRHE